MNEFDPRLSKEIASLDLTKGCSPFVDDAIQHAKDKFSSPDLNVKNCEIDVIDAGEGDYYGTTLHGAFVMKRNLPPSNQWRLIHKEDGTEAPRLVWMVDEEFAIPVVDFVKRTNGNCSYLQIGPTGEDESYLTTEKDDARRVDQVVAIRDFIKGCATQEQIKTVLNPLLKIELERYEDRIAERDLVRGQRRALGEYRQLKGADKDIQDNIKQYEGKLQKGQFTLLTEEGPLNKQYKFRMPNAWSFETEDGRFISLAVAAEEPELVQAKRRIFGGQKQLKSGDNKAVILAISRSNLAIELGYVDDLQDQLADHLDENFFNFDYNPSEYWNKVRERLSIPPVFGVSKREEKKIDRMVADSDSSTQAKIRMKKAMIDKKKVPNKKVAKKLERYGFTDYSRRQALMDAAIINNLDHQNEIVIPSPYIDESDTAFYNHIRRQIIGNAELTDEVKEHKLYQYFTQIKAVNLSVDTQLQERTSNLFNEYLGPYSKDLENVIGVARTLAKISLKHSGVIEEFPYQRSHIKMHVKGEVRESDDALAISIDLRANGGSVVDSPFQGEIYTLHPNKRTEEEIKMLNYCLGHLTVPEL